MSKIIELGNKSLDLSSIINKKDQEEPIDNKNKESDEDLNKNDMDFLDELHKNDVQNNINIIPVPIITPEEAKNKRKKIIMIQRYIQNFELDLFEFKSIDFSQKNNIELDSYLEEIQLIIGNKNANNMLGIVYTHGLSMIESYGSYLNMDLQGLSMICIKDQAIRDCLKELSIEYMSLNYVKPQYRIAMLTLGIAMSIDGQNKENKIINNYVQKNITDDFKDKYSHL
jgi:hypothetical protein